MAKNQEKTVNKDYTPPSRKQILRHLDMAIQEAKRKIESGRVYDAENEKVRIQWLKALGYLANSYRQLINDKDLDELAERVEKLEEKNAD